MRDPLTSYQEQFDAFPKGRPSYLQKIREGGMVKFKSSGFPTTQQEAWRFTNVDPISKHAFRAAPAYQPNGMTIQSIDPLACWSFGAIRLTFINGTFAKGLSSIPSLPKGVIMGPLSESFSSKVVQKHLATFAKIQKSPFVALNTAFINEGAFIYLPKGIEIEQPIQILSFTTHKAGGAAIHPRNLIVTEEKSRATIIESYLGTGSYFTNAVTEVIVKQNAFVDHYKLQQESPDAFHVATLSSQQERQGRFVSHSISLGGKLVRNDIDSVLNDEGAACVLDGLYMTQNNQHVDNHTTIEHLKPHGTSSELYKGILDGESKAVFNGQIIVRPDAQKTHAKQSNKNLLLSDNAQIDTKPVLEIHADDVKCSHGATIGRLDETQIFYLRSRGIGHAQARGLLTSAFANEIVGRIKINPLKAFLDHLIYERLKVP